MTMMQKAFEDYFKNMPWLALPFGDETKKDLKRFFRFRGIPSLIVVGPDGKTVTDNGRSAVSTFGAKGYPLTDAHLKTLEEPGLSPSPMLILKRWRRKWKSCLRNHPCLALGDKVHPV